MWFVVDPHSSVPIYVQIKEKIKALILNSKLKPGDSLPSIRTLAKDIGVNVNTVARAYRELELEGIIRAERGERYAVVGFEDKIYFETKERIIKELKSVLKRCQDLGISKEEVLRLLEEVYMHQNEGGDEYDNSKE
ncbi:GntR family transcriptional regulator [Fervidobacterium islandicum]|uniref:GntR family transcriptional regulator n=1 Tax=Fervidobacterium islandicum TaxID=2423 RepID=UPI003A7726BA